jgi:hypothetical protein
LTPSFRDIRPFTWSGFHAAVNYTFIGNIREGIDLASGYDPSLKRQIKKGEKLEFDFRKDNSPSVILHARDLEQRSFKRQGLRLEYGDEKGFTEWIMQLCAAGSAQTYMISHHGAAAGQIIILDRPKKTAYYWLAGADQEILPTGLNQLFLHLVLTDLQEQGFEYFDFVGAGTESIARYKSTFNFPLVPFYSINFSRGLAGMALKIKALNNNLLSRRNG